MLTLLSSFSVNRNFCSVELHAYVVIKKASFCMGFMLSSDSLALHFPVLDLGVSLQFCRFCDITQKLKSEDDRAISGVRVQILLWMAWH